MVVCANCKETAGVKREPSLPFNAIQIGLVLSLR